MPELPEVETLRHSLLHLIGYRIEAVDVWERRLRRPVEDDFGAWLVGRVIKSIERRGKYLLVRLSGGPSLLAHLGMSGTLVVQRAGTALTPHDHVRLRLSGGLQLTY